ncbi:sugar kinase [Sphingobium boeckii]|uniref:2-dehydro-3-deoxygluconokinase n=1 Tax=Sphingobium boeckii TaxID=1082345 RepID=A0A7W9EG29_9SPHN|nr:sugar kinase [Sphingobium boeckii]MBB5687754.1 2-dehydro-3-deoxygluconokinase [Sphingobium boeckii]
MTRFVCFGELLIRLTPPNRQLLPQSGNVDLWPGGAEANVAIGLAGLGHAVYMVSRVPDNAVADISIRALQGAGVDCSNVGRGAGRMALYFMTQGAGLRPSEVIYDRADSAFARAGAEDYDWDRAFDQADHLHLSGITAALGPKSAGVSLAAVREARKRNLTISFDPNYRATLWQAWDCDASAILGEIVSLVDILFGNHRDVALLLGGDHAGDCQEDRRKAVKAAFGAFPNLKLMASTCRDAAEVDTHHMSARIDARDRFFETANLALHGIIDRIGAGDAFVAGVLHSLANHEGDLESAARSGLALAALKHSVPGDASQFSQADIDRALVGGRDVQR